MHAFYHFACFSYILLLFHPGNLFCRLTQSRPRPYCFHLIYNQYKYGSHSTLLLFYLFFKMNLTITTINVSYDIYRMIFKYMKGGLDLPPKAKFSKERIVEAAFEIAAQQGMEA